MKVAVVGGKLQGIEAIYLAQKAGWEVLLIDKYPDVPAKGLAHSFVRADITSDEPGLDRLFKGVDLIIPALENLQALNVLKRFTAGSGLPLAFDPDSYHITSSKIKSNQLFKDLELPVPRTWPHCDFPLIMKPAGLSGSRGVRKILDIEELVLITESKGFDIDNWIIQEYIDGPSFSLEVAGINGRTIGLLPTIIDVDRKNFDCKRVLAPVNLSASLKMKLDETAIRIANALNLRGIMDVEVIQNGNELKVLEIDARLPSQTPTAVFKSTGINMLELLAGVFVKPSHSGFSEITEERCVIYEHIQVAPGSFEISGEHIMAGADTLIHHNDFFGADEALTDFEPGASHWVATLIITGANRQEVTAKHTGIIEAIQSRFHLPECIDRIPDWY